MAKDAARLGDAAHQSRRRGGGGGAERAAETAGEGQLRKENRNVKERREESRPRRQMIPFSLSAVFTSARSISIL
ncbi:MAG: hypothetical protein J5I35_05360 [Methanothrix harundinacea]|nr:hypothetical protein [Methanothrix harundinacea]